ncbi:Sec-independent protein translocase protein TatB [Marinihelvus fidelis]|nr:Sec-independent protein translocase protein TatB [Marinihelvus fidelis]
MFDVGFAELFLLSIIGLLVLGPERLPAVARTVGGFVRKARASWYTLKTSVEAELAEADVREPLKTAREELDAVSRQVTDLGREASAGMDPTPRKADKPSPPPGD